MERPILFSGAMVRAILAGEKTVTRRPVKWRESGFAGGRREPDGCPDAPTWEHRGGHTVGHVCSGGGFHGAPVLHVPALVGDRLWVRETWRPDHSHDVNDTRYRADLPAGTEPEIANVYPWRPSIHMPRKRSRLLLDVVSVRVERLHDITDADLQREGINNPHAAMFGRTNDESRRAMFAKTWAGAYGQASWNANPWVWRVEFRRVEAVR